eukprot:1181138-Prorocentrum_minimum.AAC.1
MVVMMDSAACRRHSVRSRVAWITSRFPSRIDGLVVLSLTLRGLLPGTPRRAIASQEAIPLLRSDGPEIRPGVGARPGNVRECYNCRILQL